MGKEASKAENKEMGQEKLTRQEKQDKQIQQIKDLMEENGGLVKTSQLYELGMDYRKIQHYVDYGVIDRVKNGYYAMDYKNQNEEDIIYRLFSDCVLCMESALYYYHYLKQKPFQWTLAVDKNTSKSRFKLEYPLVTPYYTEPEVLKLGVQKLPFSKGEIQIYSKERLICDMLKYDDRMDREDLKEALRSFIQDGEKDTGKLLEFAKERKVLSKVRNQIGVWL